MLFKAFFIIALLCLCGYLYGIYFSINHSEPNLCKMTYMFEYPQFVKIHISNDKSFPKYNLYAYSEGRLTENARNMNFNGAPVIFIPGNKGSYKQARSFASVALRKGIDNNWIRHLDYFSIDFNEEHLAMFGGYFEDYTNYLALCIQTILDLYKKLPNRPKRVILIAHSMGGKIAQSVLTVDGMSDLVNTIIFLSTPVDRPVVNIDFYFEAFYRKINQFLQKNKQSKNIIFNTTNMCKNNYSCSKLSSHTNGLYKIKNETISYRPLDNILMITIGGGSRDLFVHSGLTTSKFSDIHIMSTSIPNVWLTTDHLCAVWCLQQVLVLNRFIYSLISSPKNKLHGLNFIDNKETQLQLAKQYFTQEKCINKPLNVITIDLSNDIGNWIENSRLVFSEQFEIGIKRTRYQMIRLANMPQTQALSVEAIGLETDDWVFGCAATETTATMRFCKTLTSLTHLVKKIPSLQYGRVYVNIDLHQILKDHPLWTHIILRFLPTKKPFQVNIDIHNSNDRTLTTFIPKWYSMAPNNLISDTIRGSISYTVDITGLTETFKTVEFNVRPNFCSKKNHHAVATLCVPWTNGFKRYHHFTEQNSTPMNVYVPLDKPIGYNTTMNPVQINLILDPNCRYSISIKNGFEMTLSRIVLQFSHWLPGHMVAILLLSMKQQFSLTPQYELFKCGSLQSGLLTSSSFFIVTASKIFVKLVLWTKFLPIPDSYEHSLMISVLIHGTALAVLLLATGGVWLTISICGNMAYNILMKLIQLPVPIISNGILPVIEKFPMGIAVTLIAIGTVSCGGVALILAVFVYLTLLTKMYENYLQEFIYKTAKLISDKLFGITTFEEFELNEDNTVFDEIKEVNGMEETTTTTKTEKEAAMADEITTNLNENNKSFNSTCSTDIVENVANGMETDNVSSMEVETKSKEENVIEENAANAEIDKLLKETWELQQKSQLERAKEMAGQRAEYDGVHDGISPINYHLSLFLLLTVLAILNVPCVLSWAKNYNYSPTLVNDPSYVSSVATLTALSFLWQLQTPKNIQGYKTVANILYLLACFCILYCQDSVYRLNGIISGTFLIIAAHQFLMAEHKIQPIDVADELMTDLNSRVDVLTEDFSQQTDTIFN